MDKPGMLDEVDKQEASVIALRTMMTAALLVREMRPQLEEILKANRYMDNVGGLLDPTLYRKMLYSENFKTNIKMVEATLHYLDTINPYLPDPMIMAAKAGGDD
jgi:hypothetical protein